MSFQAITLVIAFAKVLFEWHTFVILMAKVSFKTLKCHFQNRHYYFLRIWHSIHTRLDGSLWMLYLSVWSNPGNHSKRISFAKRTASYVRYFFKSEMSLVIVTFLHSTLLQLFKKRIILLQRTIALFPERAEIIDLFRCKILQRQSFKFFGASTADLLKRVDDERANLLKSSFQLIRPSQWNTSVRDID